MNWSADDIPDQRGRVALVTGANSGIGWITAQVLASRGATLVLACRDPQKGRETLSRLRSETPKAKAEFLQLDLADLSSVRSAARVIAKRYPRIDLLINNAGVMTPPLGRTADGFETQFGTNVLGHFALTGLLLDTLASTPGARIVTVSSIAHRVGRIDFDNLNAERGYSRVGAYAQSKLGNLLFTYELQRRLQRAGLPAISLGAHPGGSRTELARHLPLLRLIEPLLTQPARDGAMPTLRAATEPGLQGGEYFGPKGMLTTRGPAARESSSRRSQDAPLAARLWDAMQQLTAVRYL